MKREWLIEKALLICAASSTIIVFTIVAFMLSEGYTAIDLDFILGMKWRPGPTHEEFGILPIIVSTIFVALGALGIASVIGIPCAIFLAEYSPSWIRNVVKPCVEMLVGIPSVVLGFFGLLVLVTYIRYNFGGTGECILAGWIILSIMTLPHIISISEDAVRAVPKSYREASLALGATKWETTTRVVLPNAKSGVLTSLVLGMGNAVGETMAVLMVIGNPEIPWIPASVLEPVRVLTSTIVLEISYAEWGSPKQHALFAIGIVLFIIVAILNAAVTIGIKGRLRRE